MHGHRQACYRRVANQNRIVYILIIMYSRIIFKETSSKDVRPEERILSIAIKKKFALE